MPSDQPRQVNEMVERAAEQLVKRLRLEWDLVSNEAQMAVGRDLVRIVIAASRTPAEAMKEAYDRRVDAAHLGEALTSEDAWHAMVDAALEDK